MNVNINKVDYNFSRRYAALLKGRISSSRPERLELTISDDGSGFDTNLISKSGHGLHNIRARSEKLGAQLDINSKPGSGAEIVLRLPLREK